MRTKENMKRMVTPVGIAYWPYIGVQVEKYQGKEVGYSIQLKLSDTDTEKLKKDLLKVLESAKESSPDCLNKKWSDNPLLCISRDEEGKERFKFKMKAHYTARNGQKKPLTCYVYDKKGDRIDPVKNPISPGSLIRVAFTPVPFYRSSISNGLTLRLDAIQVIEHRELEKAPSMASFGFSSLA